MPPPGCARNPATPGLLYRQEYESVGSDGSDGVIHSCAEDVLLWKLSASYRQGHLPRPGSRVGRETSIRSGAVRDGVESRVLCVRVIFSLV
jgi:hypothetical protein